MGWARWVGAMVGTGWLAGDDRHYLAGAVRCVAAGLLAVLGLVVSLVLLRLGWHALGVGFGLVAMAAFGYTVYQLDRLL